jgi:catechol 2,3-dioxygenase-like lactoylglutathione lyase family enzyme
MPGSMKVDSIDHIAITVADVERSCEFYSRVLGATIDTFGGGRKAIRIGKQKINLHGPNTIVDLVADLPTEGAADLCFLTAVPVIDVLRHLAKQKVPIELGPVERTGARGPILSVYIRDPDGNLIEIANLLPKSRPVSRAAPRSRSRSPSASSRRSPRSRGRRR